MLDIADRLPRLRMLENQFALRVRKAVIKRDNLQTQLDTLTKYRSDYQATNATIPALIMDAYCFIERLNSSISQLNVAVELQSQAIQEEERQWHKAKARTRAVELLIERQTLKASRLYHRRERKMANTLLILKQGLNTRKG